MGPVALSVGEGRLSNPLCCHMGGRSMQRGREVLLSALPPIPWANLSRSLKTVRGGAWPFVLCV